MMDDIRRSDSRTTSSLPIQFDRPATDEPMKPDPNAHAEILVLTYGLQTAAWIAETNLSTARRSDTPYWSRVLKQVTHLRDAKHRS